MGWFTNVKDWGKRILSYNTTTAVANYSYTTIEHMFEQVAAAPKVVRSIIVHPPTRTVAKHIMHIGEDIGLILIVVIGNHCLQTYGRERLEDEPNDAWLSTYTAIQATLYLMQVLTWVYCTNKKIERKTRTIIASVEAPFLLNGVKDQPGMLVCEKEKCSVVQFVMGSVINNVAYWATEAAIPLVGYIPIAGGPIAAGLYVYHNGRFVLDAVLPELCNPHKLVYLKQQSELALAIGLMHVVITSLANSLIATGSGALVPQAYAWLSSAPLDMEKILPRDVFSSAVEQLTLIAQISVAAHLNLPEAHHKTSRALPDPVWVYQQVVGFTFDTMVLGLTIKIPRMLKNRTSVNIKDLIAKLPWTMLYNSIITIHDSSLVRIFLPKLLLDMRSFIEDPIVRSNWPMLQEAIVHGLKVIEILNAHPVAGPAFAVLKRLKEAKDNNSKLGSLGYAAAKATVSSFLETFFGTPPFINNQLITLLLDDEVENKLREWRHIVQQLSLNVAIPITSDNNALLLQGQSAPVVSEHRSVLSERNLSLDAAEVIRRPTQRPALTADSVALPEAEEVIRRPKMDSMQPATNNEIEPNQVIRRRLYLLGKPAKPHAAVNSEENDWQQVSDTLSFS